MAVIAASISANGISIAEGCRLMGLPRFTYIERPGLKFLDSDPDQVARDVVAFGERVKRPTCGPPPDSDICFRKVGNFPAEAFDNLTLHAAP